MINDAPTAQAHTPIPLPATMPIRAPHAATDPIAAIPATTATVDAPTPELDGTRRGRYLDLFILATLLLNGVNSLFYLGVILGLTSSNLPLLAIHMLFITTLINLVCLPPMRQLRKIAVYMFILTNLQLEVVSMDLGITTGMYASTLSVVVTLALLRPVWRHLR
jgi:hypothetical protein